MSPRSISLLVAALVIWAALPRAARAYHLDDSLRGSSTGTQEGGSFGADGWTVTAPTDRLWFAIPTASSGSITFTLSNVTNASLFPADNDIFTMYDDADSPEPIPYRPDFVESNYKVWVRIRTEPTLVGLQKLTVAVCPNSAISHSPMCACGTGFVQEVTGGDGTWDGTPQHLRIEWGGGVVRFLRNGAEIDRVDYASTGYAWGPRALHFSFGSTRSRAVSYSGLPIGAVFSDLVVDAIDGPVASCPSVMPVDAGPPPDAGACDGSLRATQDVTAASWEPAVYSVPSELNVEADAAGTPTGVVYVRFPPVGGAVARAVLAVHTTMSPSAGGGSGQVCRVSDDTWSETTMTWATRPAVSGACSGGAHPVGVSEEVAWDVTSLVTATGDQNFAIVSNDSDGAHFYSRESGGCVLGPRLYVQLAPPGSDAAASLDAAGSNIDAAGSNIDAGSARDAHAGIDANVRDAGTSARPLASGCGCHVAARRPPPVLVALALLLMIARRPLRRYASGDSQSSRLPHEAHSPPFQRCS